MRTFKFILALGISLFSYILSDKIFHFKNAFFDPFLIIVVYYGTISRPVKSMLIGLTAGLLQDTWKEVIFGLNGFRKTLIGYLIALLSAIFDLSSVLSRLLVLSGATFIDSFIEGGLLLMRGKGFGPFFLYSLGLKLIGNSLIGGMVFLFMRKVSKREYVEAL